MMLTIRGHKNYVLGGYECSHNMKHAQPYRQECMNIFMHALLVPRINIKSFLCHAANSM